MMAESPLKHNKIVPLADLVAHPRNYRSHPKQQIDRLVLSLQRFGQGRSIVIQDAPEHPIIVAGHGIVEAARALQWQALRADILPADWTDTQIEGYLIADNLHSQEAADNEELLAMLLQEQQDAGFDLAAMGSDDETLRQMLAGMGDGYLAGDTQEGDGGDDFDTTLEEGPTRTHVGELWQLGKHRLLVGDSSVKSNIDTLLKGIHIDILHADPPYGINLLSKRGALGKSKDYNPVIGDDKPFDPAFYLTLAPISLIWGANHFANKLPPSPFWLVWDKQGGAKDTTFATCELAWCSDSQPARVVTHVWDGFRRDSERGEQRDHPNQKPVAIIEWALGWLDGNTVLEPFLGSGSTLIACHRAGKVCMGLEIDPRYCDVVIRRYEAETGQEAQLVR